MKLKVLNNVPGAVTPKMLESYRKDFHKKPVRRAAMNALTDGILPKVALNRETVNTFDFVFSNEIEIYGAPMDQERAGTCWLFADVNLIRFLAAKKLNNKDFTFSHNYHEFFDKIEKANYFLEKMIEYRKRDLLDRHVGTLLRNPVSDGGDWLYTVNCIMKYGLVPTQVMPDTWNLKNTRYMNGRLAYKCRQGAMMIRELHRKGKSVAEMRKVKDRIMSEIYSILVMFLGLPPKKFTWAYWDDGPKGDGKAKKGGGKKKKAKKGGKKKFHRLVDMTPKAFVDKYLAMDPNDYVTLLHLPVKGYPLNQTYTVELGQNTVGASDMVFLNVDMQELKNATVKSIKAGEPVLYASEAGPGTDAHLGFYHDELFDYETLFGMKFPMTKGQRIAYFQEQCNHLQLFIGVDLVKGKPTKWKLENSWGKQFGKKGLFMMSDRWFEEYIFTIIVRKKFVPRKVLNLLRKKPRLIPLGGPFA
ncbi:MAG: C1 family peptidase [Planctomycetota bacterium]|jgi:bleomycin hydrolase